MNRPRTIQRVAVTGSGYFSQFHYDGWSRLDVELAGLCSLDANTARAMADRHQIPEVFDNLERMLDTVKPDLLDIATPPPTHAGFIAAAVARGIPAICQKPFTTSLETATDTVALAEAAGVPVVVHENFRFQPWHQKIKAMLDEGAVGTPYQVSFFLRPGDGQGERAYLDRQPYFQEMPRFLIHETGIHLIDVFRYLFGEIATISAHLARLNPVIAGEDAGIIVFQFTDGPRGLFDGNRLADHPAENRRLTMGDMRIEGSDGTLRLDGDGRLFLRRHGDNDEAPVAYDWRNEGFAGDSVHALQGHVLDALRTGRAPMNTAADYLANMRAVEAVYRSATEGRVIGPDAA